MKLTHVAFLSLILSLLIPLQLIGAETIEYELEGLEADAEIRIDKWGVPHIYAKKHYDAFFVQGFNAARDRLWQIDLWRRRGLGELSEVLGPAFVEQDTAARLFLYRGSMFSEWLAYGSDSKRIAQSFTAGINAYIDLIARQPDLLPLEFELLGYEPSKWNASDPVRIRSNGLWRNVVTEVRRARLACQHGLQVDAVIKKLEPEWTTKIPAGLDPCDIPADVLKLYSLSKAPVDFRLASQFQQPASKTQSAVLAQVDHTRTLALLSDQLIDAGSNNWAVAPDKTITGRPILANDPHRGHAVPSLRYIAHLVAPGINVIGAGEPGLPGISIGHNEKIAFGLTIFSIDQEDLVVYDQRRKGKIYQYKYLDKWVDMKTQVDEIKVKGQDAVSVPLLFTRDGPVIYKNRKQAFAVRAAWLEPGMAPYFGSIEYMRAQNWDEFLAALNRWGAPAENQVYADTQGNIGYKPAGLTPIRTNYDGLLPVPGNGAYEWHGFYDMDQLPVQYNPENGYVATANAMSLPKDFPYQEKITGFEWANPWRINRIREILDDTPQHNMDTSIDLQRDYVSLPARRLLQQIQISELPAPASTIFSQWNYQLERDSSAATLFEVWMNRHLTPMVIATVTGIDDPAALASLDNLSAIDEFEKLNETRRTQIVADSMAEAILDVEALMGADPTNWQWGRLHKMKFTHPLVDLVDEDTQALLSIPIVSRGGSGDTANSTRYRKDFSVASGGSWRMVIDVGEWDNAVMTNAPGQSGDPSSPHYDDMLQTWADEGHMPLLYSREKVVANTRVMIKLKAK
jgi:penicillin amidase